MQHSYSQKYRNKIKERNNRGKVMHAPTYLNLLTGEERMTLSSGLIKDIIKEAYLQVLINACLILREGTCKKWFTALWTTPGS